MRAAAPWLMVLVLLSAACPEKKEAVLPSTVEEVPARPQVNEAMLRSAFGPHASLGTDPLIRDLDPAPGEEALLLVDIGGRNFHVAVIRSNGQVLTRAPMGGEILAHANVRQIGALRVTDLLGDGKALIQLPVVTLVNRQWVCGILVFRYRGESLVLVGELASRCWTRESGAKEDQDPYSLMTTEPAGPNGQPAVRMTEDEGSRLYRWDESQAAFVSLAKERGK